MTNQEIEQIISDNYISDYTINPDGTVDVNGHVMWNNRNFTKIPFKFNKVTGSFCVDNCGLDTLENSPKWVGGWFSCKENNLTSLIGSPDYVGDWFSCNRNKLTSLVGCSKQVNTDISANENSIKNFDGFDSVFGGKLYIMDNPLGSIYPIVDFDFVNAFKIYQILKGDEVNLKRLKYIMSTWNHPVDLERIEKYYKIV